MPTQPPESSAESDPDPSYGYDAVADAFCAARDASSTGVATVLDWAGDFAPGTEILDVACGSGKPLALALRKAGFAVAGIDASARLCEAFCENLPGAPVRCEAAEHSDWFGRQFAGVICVGLVFLLPEHEQPALIANLARAVAPGGSLLLSAPAEAGDWNDLLTGRRSVSLGADRYRELLRDTGLAVARELDDEGGNHYYAAHRPAG